MANTDIQYKSAYGCILPPTIGLRHGTTINKDGIIAFGLLLNDQAPVISNMVSDINPNNYFTSNETTIYWNDKIKSPARCIHWTISKYGEVAGGYESLHLEPPASLNNSVQIKKAVLWDNGNGIQPYEGHGALIDIAGNFYGWGDNQYYQCGNLFNGLSEFTVMGYYDYVGQTSSYLNITSIVSSKTIVSGLPVIPNITTTNIYYLVEQGTKTLVATFLDLSTSTGNIDQQKYRLKLFSGFRASDYGDSANLKRLSAYKAHYRQEGIANAGTTTLTNSGGTQKLDGPWWTKQNLGLCKDVAVHEGITSVIKINGSVCSWGDTSLNLTNKNCDIPKMLMTSDANFIASNSIIASNVTNTSTGSIIDACMRVFAVVTSDNKLIIWGNRSESTDYNYIGDYHPTNLISDAYNDTTARNGYLIDTYSAVSGVYPLRNDGELRFTASNQIINTTVRYWIRRNPDTGNYLSVKQAAINNNGCIALLTDGTVVGWGNNLNGQFGDIAHTTNGRTYYTFSEVNAAIAAGKSVVSVGAGPNNTVITYTNSGCATPPGDVNMCYFVKSWGTGAIDYTTNKPPILPYYNQTQVDNMNDYGANITKTINIASGNMHNISLRENGKVFTNGLGSEYLTYSQYSPPNTYTAGWNTKSYNQGNVAFGYSNFPYLNSNKPIGISAGGFHSSVLLNNYKILSWGDNSKLQCGATSEQSPYTTPTATSSVYTATGSSTTYPPYWIKTPPAGTYYIKTYSGLYFGLALRATTSTGTSGTAIGWGDSTYQQYNGISTGAWVNIKDLSAGGYHTLGLNTSGKVLAAGSTATAGSGAGLYNYGQSTGTTLTSLTSGVLQIAAGLYHSVALKTSTNIVAWGRNNLGQTVVPVALTNGNTNITKITSGCNSNHTVALDSLGNVWAWGDNQYGQCGTLAQQYNSDGSADTTSTTVAANSLAAGGSKYWKITKTTGYEYTDIAAGFSHTLVLEKITGCSIT